MLKCLSPLYHLQVAPSLATASQFSNMPITEERAKKQQMAREAIDVLDEMAFLLVGPPFQYNFVAELNRIPI